MAKIIVQHPKPSKPADEFSGDWIRGQLQKNGDAEALEEPHTGKSDAASDDDVRKSGSEHYDDSVQELASALSHVTAEPLRALQEAWSERLQSFEGRLTEQRAALGKATDKEDGLEEAVGTLRDGLNEHEERSERAARKVKQLNARLDSLEADLREQIREISSSIDPLRDEITVHQAAFEKLRQEGDRRTKVAERVAQMLDNLRESAAMLAESSESSVEETALSESG